MCRATALGHIYIRRSKRFLSSTYDRVSHQHQQKGGDKEVGVGGGGGGGREGGRKYLDSSVTKGLISHRGRVV